MLICGVMAVNAEGVQTASEVAKEEIARCETTGYPQAIVDLTLKALNAHDNNNYYQAYKRYKQAVEHPHFKYCTQEVQEQLYEQIANASYLLYEVENKKADGKNHFPKAHRWYALEGLKYLKLANAGKDENTELMRITFYVGLTVHSYSLSDRAATHRYARELESLINEYRHSNKPVWREAVSWGDRVLRIVR